MKEKIRRSVQQGVLVFFVCGGIQVSAFTFPTINSEVEMEALVEQTYADTNAMQVIVIPHF